jgi:hypothetical protein
MHPFSFAYIDLVAAQYPLHGAKEEVCNIQREHRDGQDELLRYPIDFVVKDYLKFPEK